MKCARTACQEPLKVGDEYYEIDNNQPNPPRVYCRHCGHTITSHNQAHDSTKLKFEIKVVK